MPQLTARDVAALLLLGEMYGAQGDQLEQVLNTSAAAVRQVTMRWRKAGLAETRKLGPGPVWCWLTKHGLDICGLGYKARPPTLGRLAHVRAALAVRLVLERWQLYRDAGGTWRSERHLRTLIGGSGSGRLGAGRRGHVPDGEVLWRSDVGEFAGQVWGVEVELTPKAGGRTTAIMAELLGRTTDYGPASSSAAQHSAGTPRYARVLYVVSSAARATVERARDSLADAAARRIDIRPIPDGAELPAQGG